MLKYKAKECFQIDIKHIFLINKLFKKIKSRSLIKQTLKKLLCLIAAFNVIITLSIKIVYHIDVIIYNDIIIIAAIDNVVEIFFNL